MESNHSIERTRPSKPGWAPHVKRQTNIDYDNGRRQDSLPLL